MLVDRLSQSIRSNPTQPTTMAPSSMIAAQNPSFAATFSRVRRMNASHSSVPSALAQSSHSAR
jgi:hypothetical protein